MYVLWLGLGLGFRFGLVLRFGFRLGFTMYVLDKVRAFGQVCIIGCTCICVRDGLSLGLRLGGLGLCPALWLGFG